MKRGTMIGGTYQVMKTLGAGGQSDVWLVLHKRTCALMALKRIPLKAQWPRGELDYARHLEHPGLPKIYDIFLAEGCVWIAMEYLEGKTLEQLKQERGRFSEKELRQWLKQLTEILAYLHSRTPPLIHGDIKPSNLMIDPEGKLILLDFGACLTAEGKKKERYGTRIFAAPEQLDGTSEMDIRSDFYSCGKTFRFLSGGKESRSFRRFLDVCMEADREKRFLNDQKLRRRLDQVCRRGKRICLLFSLLAVFCLFFGSISHFRRRSEAAEEQYQILMESSRTKELVSAIRLFPGREAAYRKLLEMDLLDQEFTREESQLLEEILEACGAKLEKEAYGALAYELGIAYWYYFQQAEGRSYAGIWFERALAGELDTDKRKKAEIYRELGAYCEKKTRQELSGEGEMDWNRFFDAIRECCEGNSQNEVPLVLRERLQEELLALTYEGLLHFRNAGVSEESVNVLIEALKNMADGKEEAFSAAEASVRSIYGNSGAEADVCQ